MSSLAISSSAAVSTAQTVQSSRLPSSLEKMGVRYEEWELGSVNLNGVDLSQPSDGLIQQILLKHAAREKWIYDFRGSEGAISIFQLTPQSPGLDELIKKFAKRHTHSAPEVRLILDGAGVFTIWDKENQAHDLPVKRGSFMVIPANCIHTFQLTDAHQVTALRVFQDKDGWIPHNVD